jgi:Zn-dependent metalloprotease
MFTLLLSVTLSCFAQKQPKDFETALRQNAAVASFEMDAVLKTPAFIRFKDNNLPDAREANALISNLFQFEKDGCTLVEGASTLLKDGLMVAKYKQVFQGVPVEHSAVIVNERNGKILSITAAIFDFSTISNAQNALSEDAALTQALGFVKATEYSWQAIEQDKNTFKSNPALVARLDALEEARKPKGALVFARDVHGSNGPRLAWKFNVYATQPLSRHYIYVDAENGKVLLADAIIKHADAVNASAQAAKKHDHASDNFHAQMVANQGHALGNSNPQITENQGNALKNADAKTTKNHNQTPEYCGASTLTKLPISPSMTATTTAFASVLGSAQTRYAGTRDIYTTLVNVPLTGTPDPNNTSVQLSYSGEDPRTTVLNASVYILKDDTRGGGIETYDMNNAGGTPVSVPGLHANSLAFVDLDNNWKNESGTGTHEDLMRGATSNGSVGADEGMNDDYAIDAHWGAEMVYDYWKIRHGRLSFDNKNSTIKSYTHYGPAYDNAFWNGSVMTYGDGSGTSANNGFRPLTSLDVCAHEVGHGVCSFTSDLVYQGESGAMNEGLSDIWAACIENYTSVTLGMNLPFHPFQIGEQIAGDNIGLRRMDNPKAKTDPDTYGGRYWQDPNCSPPSLANDQCGVHGNSGVLNKYFYLLVKGPLATTGAPTYTDDGRADNGTTVATENLGNIYAGVGSPIPAGEFVGLGFAKAEAITYLMELNLTPNATFAQARVAAINAARLLYGICSQEEKTVTDAFYAVNIGARYMGCSAPLLDAYAVQTSINEGVATNDCVRFNEITFSASLTAAQASPVTITFAKTAGTLGNNEWAFKTGNTITYNAGETGVKSIAVKVFDDALVEGSETLQFTATSALSALNKVINLTIADNDIVPSIGGVNTLINENFEGFTEGAFPSSGSGWVAVNKTSPINVQWAARTDGAAPTPLIYTSKRAIIEQTTPALPGEATYDQNLAAQTYLRTPQIVATGLSNLTVSFSFQAGGEAACSPACDYGQLVYSFDGTNFEQFNAAPLYTTLTETNFSTVLPQSLEGKTFYLGVLWYNDANAGTTASVAIDNFLLTGEGIVIDSTLNTSKSEPLTTEIGKTNYFYSKEGNEIIARLQSTTAFDYGCTEAKVEKAGFTPFTLFTSGSLAHKVAGKVVKITPTTNNTEGSYDITLYFTEHEIRKLEEETGKTRSEFYIYKVNGSAYTQANQANTTYLPATYTAVGGGGTFKATFNTGFSSFALGFPPPIPNLSPTVSVLPSSLVGVKPISVVVSVFEFNDNPTNSPTTVYIPKDSKYTLSFNPTATTVSGTSVQNSLWSFDGASNAGFYILTSTSVIPASGSLKVGLTSSFNPNSQKGSTLVKVILLDNSGGEAMDSNGDNQNQTVLIYTF